MREAKRVEEAREVASRFTSGSRWLALASCALMLTAIPMPHAAAVAANAPKFTDSCAVQRQPFSAIKNYRLNKTFEGAAKGLAIGIGLALLNEAIGPKERYVDNSGRVRTRAKISSVAIIAASTTVGAVGANQKAQAKSQEQREVLHQALAEQFLPDVATFSPLAQKLVDLGECRKGQIAAVTAAHAAGEIDSKLGIKQLKMIEKWIAADDKAIDAAAKKQSRFVQGYSVAVARIDAEDPAIKLDGAQLAKDAEARAAAFMPVVGPAQTVAAPVANDIVLEARYVTARSGARMRDAPSTSGAVVGALPYAAEVLSAPEGQTGWFRIEHGELAGFVDGSLISETRPAAPVRAQPTKLKPAQVVARKRQPAQPKTAKDQLYVVVANGMAFNEANAQRGQALTNLVRQNYNAMRT